METKEYWCLIPCDSISLEIIYLAYTYHRFMAQILLRYNINIDNNLYKHDGILSKYGDYYILRCTSDNVKAQYIKSLRKYSIKQILE